MKITILAAAASLVLVGWAAPVSASPADGVSPLSACGCDKNKKKKKKGSSVVDNDTNTPRTAQKSACGGDGNNKKKKKKKGNSVADDDTNTVRTTQKSACGCDKNKKKKKKKGES